MKKSLLLLAGAMLASASASAQAITEPTIFGNLVVTAISPNGKWAVSSDDFNYAFGIINIETGDVDYYAEGLTPDYYSGSTGNYVSNDGTVVASRCGTDLPCYWKGGQWYDLPLRDTDYSGSPNAITPDGSRIVGWVGRMAFSLEPDDVMTVPVAWDRKADGTYGDYVELPYPRRDWSNRLPMYILVDYISEDGTKVAAQVHDYMGFTSEPLLISQNADGEWSYEKIHPELTISPDVVLPDYPGEAPDEPNPLDFMTDDEIAAYNQALLDYENRDYPQPEQFMSPDELAAYQEAMDLGNEPDPMEYLTEEEQAAYWDAVNTYWEYPYPVQTDYMTDAEIAAYNDALAAYQPIFEEWQLLYSAYENALFEVLAEATTYSMNNAIISPDGRYFATCVEVEDGIDPMTGWPSVKFHPCVFDLQTGEYDIKEGCDILPTCFTADGMLLGGSPSGSYDREAYIAPSYDADFVPFTDFVQVYSPDLYSWMMVNMTHQKSEYDMEVGDVVTREVTITGTPVVTPDMSFYASWAYNTWADENDWSAPFTFSYLIPCPELAGIGTVVADGKVSLAVSMSTDGSINIVGNAASVAVYDLNGRRVFNAANPAATVVTGLRSGAYVVKATDAAGNTAIAKAII